MLLFQFLTLLFPAESEVAILGAGQDGTRPGEQCAKIGITQAGAAADEHERVPQAQRAQNRLRMGIAEHDVVAADAQHHRLRFLPVAVEMQHAFVIAA
jgi:hypothetical protein